MRKNKNWVARICALGFSITAGSLAFAGVQDASIVIDHALNSPTLTVRYSGAHVALVELRLNGASFGTRSTDPGALKGETDFTINASSLSNGDNSVEVRLYDGNGKLLGTEKSSVSAGQGEKAPVYLVMPKVGSTVQGPVQINVGFGRELHNTYVSFFIDNQFKSMTNSPPFSYIWDTTRDANGWHEVEAWAVDDSSTTYKTKRVKLYVNNPGGNTYRQFNQPEAPRVEVSAPAPAVASVPKTASIVTSGLRTSVASPSVHVNTTGAALKGNALGATAIAQHAGSAILPTVTAHVAVAKRAKPMITISNDVYAGVGSAAGVKSQGLGASVATGPQILLPTGKRIAIPTVKPVLSGPIGGSAVHHLPAIAKAPVLPKVATLSKLPTLPRVTVLSKDKPAAVAIAQPKVELVVKPKLALVSLKTAVERVARTAKTAASVPVAKAHQIATKVLSNDGDAENLHPAAQVGIPATKAVSSVASIAPMAIGHGAKLPNIGTFTILLNSRAVKFDSVKPRVQNNVPLTPFRYLFEQDGGKVDWKNSTKSVTANHQGREVYIRIGDKLAKVNNLPVELDLTPFIENGRTIVPLSFIKDALDVEVDYDPITNHVLITSTKKK